MKNNKEHKVTVRLTELQYELIEKVINDGKATTTSSALQYILNSIIIKGGI